MPEVSSQSSSPPFVFVCCFCVCVVSRHLVLCSHLFSNNVGIANLNKNVLMTVLEPRARTAWAQLWGLLGTCLLHVPVVLLWYNIGVCNLWRPCGLFHPARGIGFSWGCSIFLWTKNKQWLVRHAKSWCLLPWFTTSIACWHTKHLMWPWYRELDA